MGGQGRWASRLGLCCEFWRKAVRNRGGGADGADDADAKFATLGRTDGLYRSLGGQRILHHRPPAMLLQQLVEGINA